MTSRPLGFRVMLVTDWSQPKLLERLEAALQGVGEVAVQHRHPAANDLQFLEESRALARICGRYRVPLFINRRLDVAALVEAHVHLPAHGLSVADVRAVVGAKCLISYAMHSHAERQPGADLALVSPVYPPRSKPDDTRPLLGPPGFAALARTLDCPAFALGGVSASNLEPLRATGELGGVALMGGVLDAEEPREALRALGASLRP